jgi:hypothetical protein
MTVTTTGYFALNLVLISVSDLNVLFLPETILRYVVRTVHFGMEFYSAQSYAQVFNLFIYLLLPYMFRAFF